jgi:hypothetical protein
MSRIPAEDETAGGRRLRVGRRGLLAALAAGVLLVLVVGAVVLGRGNGAPGGEPGAAATSGSAASSASAAPGGSAGSGTPAPGEAAPTGVVGSVDAPPPSLPQVSLQETAAVGDGVTVAVAAIESFQGQATGPGNVNGPALRVTLRITNGTGGDIALDGVAVNVAYGDSVTPASPLDDPSRAPFSGSVAPGKSAEGAYVFSVPSGAADPAVVEVGYRPGAPLVVFVGPVA